MRRLVVDEDVLVELVLDGKRFPNTAFLIAAQLFVVIPEKPRLPRALGGGTPAGPSEGVNIYGH